MLSPLETKMIGTKQMFINSHLESYVITMDKSKLPELSYECSRMVSAETTAGGKTICALHTGQKPFVKENKIIIIISTTTTNTTMIQMFSIITTKIKPI